MSLTSLKAKITSCIRAGRYEVFTSDRGKVIVETSLFLHKDGYMTPNFKDMIFNHISDLEPEEIDSLEKYQYSLLDTIELLRMASNGSYGGLGLETVDAIYNLLCGRLDNWQPSSDPYSEHIRKMLELTLESYRNSFWRK